MTRTMVGHLRRRAAAVGVLAAVLAAGATSLAGPASASAPPPSWTNERVLDCDGRTVLTYLTPGGFGTPFFVVGTRERLIPKYVEVVLPSGEGPFVTVDVPGFDRSGDAAVHCRYVDPAGLAVDFWGLRT